MLALHFIFLFFIFFNFLQLLYLFIYLFIFGCVGSSVRARAFSSCGKWGPLFIAVRGPLFIAVRGPFTIAAPPAEGHRLQTRRLSSCGSRAQPLRGMWDLPRPGLEPVSPAPAGRLPTTAPPGKPSTLFLKSYSSLGQQTQSQGIDCQRFHISWCLMGQSRSSLERVLVSLSLVLKITHKT